ncbi:hypothetical protein [Chryseobacterium indoltheticum]|uniref:hypothetical protein n=1 Tax=Chryseobacterium indoltheticum TaxID=254 RepID=UPI003F494779
MLQAAPNGKSWIDSSTLMLRLQIPQIWSGLRPMEYSAKEDDDMDMGMKSREALNKASKTRISLLTGAKLTRL